MKPTQFALLNEQAILAAEGILPMLPAHLDHGQVALANDTMLAEAYWSEELTGYSVGWKDQRNIEETLDFCAPPVPVNRLFRYTEFTHAEAFLEEPNDEDIRAMNADFKTVKPYTETKTNAETENKGLTIILDLDRVLQKPNWRQRYTGKLTERLLRTELRRAVALISAAATNTAVTWDTTAGKDPDQDIKTGLLAGETASGIYPNRVCYGATAWNKRGLSHRAQNLAGGYASAGQTPAQVAAFLGVDAVHVSSQRYRTSASALAELVNNLVFGCYCTTGVDEDDPANCKRFFTPTEGGTKYRVYEQQLSAKLYAITVEHYSLVKITSTLGLRKWTVS